MNVNDSSAALRAWGIRNSLQQNSLNCCRLTTPSTASTAISIRQKKPSIEDIVDEALAILEDRDRIIRKKKSEYYNSKINEYMLRHDLEDDPNQNDPS